MGRALAVMLAIDWLGRAALACPNCAAALLEGGGAEAGNMVAGFYYSILFMLGVPLLLGIGFGIFFYRLSRQAVRAGEPCVVEGRAATAPAS